jgi:hypothetical protein
MDQLVQLQKHDLPETIGALDAHLSKDLSDEQINDLEYQFKVVFTLSATSKSRAHIQFVNPGSEVAQEIRNVLIKYKSSNELYPHKATAVANIVAKRSGKAFTNNTHTNAWRRYKIRPKNNAKNPSETNKEYRLYHPAFNGYTYSNQWIEFLVSKAADVEEYAALRKGKN